MPQKFVNLENLTSFWGNAKKYIGNERKEIEDQLYNWQKTEKAPVVQCEPVPNSELHPVVNFSFTETPPANGEKGPDNPSTITGISSVKVTRCGKNLLYRPYYQNSITEHGLTITANSDGTVTINGTSRDYPTYFSVCDSSTENAFASTHIKLADNVPHTISLKTVSGSYTGNDAIRLQYMKAGDGLGVGDIAPRESVVIDKTSSHYAPYMKYRLRFAIGASFNNLVVAPQLELGSIATAYEPYEGTEYTIALNNTYYGGSIDLFTGLITVTHSLVELNGETYLSGSIFEELADVYTVGFYPNPQRLLTLQSNDDCACSCLPTAVAYGEQNYSCVHLAPSAMAIRINIAKTELGLGNGESGDTVRTAVHAWLVQHPGVVIYPIANPQTVQLIPQQIKSLSSLEGTSKRINTLYTDADSIQVEYQKYVGIDSILNNDSVNAIQNKVVNSALNTKVSLSGNETINGTKTFSNTINGNITGDAGTVAGYIVSKDVPVNAAFTDTTYDPATQSTAGLMSASDKVKLDAVGSVFSFKGSVTDSSSLPVSDNVNGDAYLAEDTGHVHVYDGTSFVDIGIWAGIPSATDAQIDALFED